MTRMEAMEALAAALKARDPVAYRSFMQDLLASLGYADMADALDDALRAARRDGDLVPPFTTRH